MNKRGILCILVLSLLLISPVFAHRRALHHDSYDVYVGAVRQENYAYAGDYYWMRVSFENNIRDKPDLKLAVYIPDLGVYERKIIRNAKQKKFSEPVLLPIPHDAEPGEYFMRIVISSDGFKRVKYRFIEVKR